MPEEVDECVESVLDEHPEYSESRAYAICWAEKNRGNLSVGEDASHDDLLRAAAEAENDCPEGEVKVNDRCVPVEDVDDVPPGALEMSGPRVHLAGFDTDPIEREELSGGNVAYKNISFLSEGVWTDQASETPTLYPAEAFENIEAEYDNSKFDGPPVNEMHDVDPDTGEVNDTSLAGYIDPDSLHVDGRTLRGDVILDTSKKAGDLADERLQDALESGGKLGYGGPSVELDLDRQEHIQQSDHPRAVMEITGGYLTGLGLVMNQADKNIGFDRETAQRAVAMSADGQTDKALVLERRHMADAETVRDILESNGLDTGDMTDEEVMAIYDELMDSAEDEAEEEDVEAGDGEGYDDEEEDDEEEEEATEMADDGAIDVIEEQIDDLWDAIDELQAEMASGEELSEELEAAREELADAETVAELEDAKDDLEKRLSEVEDESKEPRTLAEGAGEEDVDWSNADSGVNFDPARNTLG